MRMRWAYGLLAVGALALTACGPVPVSVAEDQCLRIAERTRPLSGEAKIGINQDGKAIYDIDAELSLGSLTGRDPNEVYNSCVYQKSGQLPTRPLYSRTEWKG